jgi:hypothetical protein
VSASEKFINPKVLARIVESVEWEGNLEVYKNGTSNQGEFMRALGLLYGRWLSDEDLPDAWAAAKALNARDWVAMFKLVLRVLPERIEQCAGFWSGTFGGFLKPAPKARWLVNPWTGEINPNLPDEDSQLGAELGQMFVELRTILEGVTHG